MKFALTLLGVNSATPAFGRYPSSQVLQIENHFFLIDCGEGTQMRMWDFNIPKSKINHIFISHLHGDHVFGLPGLLFSYSLNGRKFPLHLYSPAGLREMVMAQLNPGGTLSYELYFHEIETETPQLIFEDTQVEVSTLPLLHRIPTVGFLFREKPRPLNIRPEQIEKFELTIPQIKAAKHGDDVVLDDGRLIPNSSLTKAPLPARSYAYISDTAYHEGLVPFIRGVDLLYHETTFCQDLAEMAQITMHSTAMQAALIAKKANVGKLLIGHYSSRYKDLEPFLTEAKSEFGNTHLGVEGMVYEVDH